MLAIRDEQGRLNYIAKKEDIAFDTFEGSGSTFIEVDPDKEGAYQYTDDNGIYNYNITPEGKITKRTASEKAKDYAERAEDNPTPQDEIDALKAENKQILEKMDDLTDLLVKANLGGTDDGEKK